MFHHDPLMQLPTGFGAALMQDSAAMAWFSALSSPAQQTIIERTRALRSKEEMRAFVSQMGMEGTKF